MSTNSICFFMDIDISSSMHLISYLIFWANELVILLSHLSEYVAYSQGNCQQLATVKRRLPGIPKCSLFTGFCDIRNIFLKFVRKSYSQYICKQSQAIRIDGNALIMRR